VQDPLVSQKIHVFTFVFCLMQIYRWPSVRPDVVVTKEDFDKAIGNLPGTPIDKFEKATKSRQPWTIFQKGEYVDVAQSYWVNNTG
jgi:hypothetical protein